MILDIIIGGPIRGSVYAPLAVGFSLIFSVTLLILAPLYALLIKTRLGLAIRRDSHYLWAFRDGLYPFSLAGVPALLARVSYADVRGCHLVDTPLHAGRLNSVGKRQGGNRLSQV